MAGTATNVESMRDVLMIDAESGDLSLAFSEANVEHIDVVTVTTFSQVARVYDYLKLHCELRERYVQLGGADSDSDEAEEVRQKLIALEAKFKFCEPEDIIEPRLYRTVIVDSLTEIDTYCMYQLLGIRDQGRLDEEATSAEWSEYKKNNTMMLRLIRQMRNLPINLLMIAAANFIQDETKKFNYKPALTGKMAAQVQGFMDLVGYLTVVEGAPADPSKPDDERALRRLYVQPVGRFDAKARFPTFKGSYFDNPTMGKILKAVGLQTK